MIRLARAMLAGVSSGLRLGTSGWVSTARYKMPPRANGARRINRKSNLKKKRIRKAAGSRLRHVEKICQNNSRANFNVGCAERSAAADVATHSVVFGADQGVDPPKWSPIFSGLSSCWQFSYLMLWEMQFETESSAPVESMGRKP
jgi:hypothetical protein